MSSVQKTLKRYNLAVPETLYTELQKAAETRHTSVVELLRRFIKLGLLALDVERTPGSALFIREGDHEREILFY